MVGDEEFARSHKKRDEEMMFLAGRVCELEEHAKLADETAALYYKLGAEALGAEEWERRCRAALNVT